MFFKKLMNPLQNLFFFGSSPLILENQGKSKVISTTSAYLSDKTLGRDV